MLDALGLNDIDYTGVRALSDVLDQLSDTGIRFAIARAGRTLHEELRRAGIAERIGENHFFPAVDEAVATLGSSESRTEP